MKRLLITAMVCALAGSVHAQDTKTDSVKKDTSNHPADWSWSNRDDEDTTFHYRHHHHGNSGFSIGLTFSRFDLGLTTLVDNGSFTLSPKNEFLRYRSWKSSNVGFDVFQFGYRFTDVFKVYVSGGFDWTLLRLREDITILPNQPVLTYRTDSIHYSKNRFSSSYLRIPLSFDIRTHEDSRGNRAHFVFGPMAGILLNGRVKQISQEHGKQKIDDDYHFAKVRYGGFVRVGYAGWGVFAKYYTNDMFENSPDQKGLRNFSFGFTFGF
jgi:hypothetical protein